MREYAAGIFAIVQSLFSLIPKGTLMTLFQQIQQFQAGAEQGIYSESEYKKLLLEILLTDQTIAIVDEYPTEEIGDFYG